MILALFAVSYSQPLHRWAFTQLTGQLERDAGVIIRADSIAFSPLGLTLTLDGVSVASRSTPTIPYLTAAHVELFARASVLRGRPFFDRIRVVEPVLDLRKVAGSGGPSAPFRGFGSLQFGSVAIENLSFVVGEPDTTRVTLRGLSLSGTSEAPGRLRLESVTPASLVLEIGDATLPFDALTTAFSIDGDQLKLSRLEARSMTALVQASGRATFNTGYPIEIDYRTSIDLAKVAGWWGQTSTLQGHAAISGQVAGPFLSPRATARADARAFAWSTLSPGRLTADALITGPGIQLNAVALDVPELTARGKGFLTWSRATPRSALTTNWRTPALRRLGPLVELTPTDIPLVAAEGTAAITWRGLSPDLGELAGTIDARLSAIPSVQNAGGHIAMTGGNARWRVDWQQQLPGDTSAHAQFALHINPDRFGQSGIEGSLDLVTADVAAAATSLDRLAVPMPDVLLTYVLGGSARMTGPLTGVLSMPHWRAALAADHVVVSGLEGIGIDGTFDVDPRRFSTQQLALRAPRSQGRVAGVIGVLDGASDVTFDGAIDAGWASAPFVPAAWPLSGATSVTGTWSTREGVSDLTATFESRAATAATRAVGPVSGRIRVLDDALTGGLWIPDLGCRVEGAHDLASGVTQSVHADCKRADAGRWLAMAGVAPSLTEGVHVSIDGRLDAAGSLASLDTAEFTIGLDRIVGEIRGRPVTLSAPASVRWARGVLDADTLTARIGDATIGILPAADDPGVSSVRVAAALADILALMPSGLVPVGLVADGVIRIDARVPHAAPRAVTATATADVVSVARNAVRIAGPVSANATLTADRFELKSLGGTILGASVTAAGSAPTDWLLAQDAPAGTASTAQPEEAQISGTVDATLANVLDAAGLGGAAMTASARGAFALASRAPRLDAIRGAMTVDAFTLQNRAGTFTHDGPWRVRLEDRVAIIEALSVTGPDSTITAAGRVGLSADGAVDIRLTGTASMSLVDSFVAPRVDGFADLDLRVAGTIQRSTLEGTLALRHVSALSPRAKLVLADFGGGVVFTPKSVEFIDLRGQLNGGSVTIAGSMPVQATDGGGGTVSIVARDVFVEYPPGLRNRISADLSLSGGLVTPKLGGTTTLLTDPYRESLPKMAALLSAMMEPSRSLGKDDTSLPGRVSLDVAIRADVPPRFDNSLGQIELMPRLRVVGTVGRPSLDGTVDILDNGTIRLQSRNYVLTDSRLDFAPEDGFVPRLHLSGATTVGEYAITLQISGAADAMEMALSSDPPLPERDLQALLLTGESPDAASSSEGPRQFAITALSSDLLGFAGQALGLDYVRIGSENFELISSDLKPTTRLTMSKTLLKRFEVVFSENLDQNATTWIVVYKPRAGFELRLASLDNLDRTLEVRHHFGFGPGGTTSASVKDARGPVQARATKETVGAVRVLGEAEAVAARIKALLELGPGKTFDYRSWMRDQDRVRRFYHEASRLTARVIPIRTVIARQAGVAPLVDLEYRITQGPVTAVVVKGFAANPAFIERLRVAWSATSSDQFATDDMTRAAREMLIDRGHVNPVVRTTLLETIPGSLVASVTITPGPLVARRTVVFEGATVFSEETLSAFVSTPAARDEAWRDPQSLCAAIVELYATAGYRGAVAAAEPARILGDAAVLLIRITEGPATRLESFTLLGIPAARLGAARDAARLVTGEPLAAREERAARLRVERHLKNLGYRDARVTVSLDSPGSGAGANVTMTVAEGSLRVVRSVVVEGAETTRPSLVSSAILLKPGDPASQGAISATQRRLYQLGTFSSAEVRIEPVAQSSDEMAAGVSPVRALVSLVEPRRYQFVYGLEFSNAYGPIFENFQNALGVAADVRDRNLWGRGVAVSFGGRYDSNIKSVRALLSVPTLAGKPIRTNVYLGWRDKRADNNGADVIDEVSRSGSIEQRWTARPWLDFSWGYQVSDRRFFVRATRDSGTFGSDGLRAAVSGSVAVDRRDNPLDAHRGWFHSSSLQVGARLFGSDLGYTRYVGQGFFFASAGALVSASAVRFGALWSVKADDLFASADMLFTTGGSQTVRGYRQGGLSAGSYEGVSLGGTRLLVINEELRLSVVKWLQGVVFADVGNVFGAEGFAVKRLAVGLGFGVRIRTPVVPLRVDFGFPVPRRPGDPTFRWYVSVGQIF